MTSPDIGTATALSREQAWPHREEDWALFLEAGEGIVAEQAGRVLGTVMAWRYGEDFATVGMVIVASAVQGQGLGRKLMVLRDMRKRGNLDRRPLSARRQAGATCAWLRRPGGGSCPRQS
jgi:predicted N-acetyltransferase YhbS